MTNTRPTVAIIGGGISGLACAFELTGGAVCDPLAPEVIVLEAAATLGGKVQAASFSGRPIDLGPDGFLARRPEAVQLCHELGIDHLLRAPGETGASLFVRGALRPMPQGLNLGIPTSWRALRSSKVLTARGLVRAGRDVVMPRRDLRGPLGDRAIGPLVAQKLGQEVVDVLVDPMIGGIHAGRVSDMSAAAVFPPLLAAAGHSGSLMHALALPVPDPSVEPSPVFFTLEGGTGSIIDHLRSTLEERGVTIRCSTSVTSVARGRPGVSTWSLLTSDGPYLADGVVVATPATAAASLLSPIDHELTQLLSAIDYSSVVLCTFSFAQEGLLDHLGGTGLLVPTVTRRPATGDSYLTTAVTSLDRKWPHLKRDGSTVLRVSTGKIDDHRAMDLSDADLTEHLLQELHELVGITEVPTEVQIMRWHEALPQYRVNHGIRVSGIESAVRALPGLDICGAALHGVGIPACISSGRSAGSRLADELGCRSRSTNE